MAQLAEDHFTSDTLLGLGSSLPGIRGPLSPFVTRRSLAPRDIADLAERGLVDRRGVPTGRLRATLASLAAPEAAVQLRLQTGGLLLEHVVYHVGDGRRVMLTTAGDEVAISDPAPVDEVLEAIQQLMGGSILRGLDFGAEFRWSEARALGALIDQHRRSALRALVEPGKAAPTAFSASEIASAAASREGSTQWLASLLNLVGTASSAESLRSALDRLVETGHAAREDRGYRLVGAAALVGGRLLIVDQVLLWGVVRVGPTGDVVRADQLCLQAGVIDVLTVETTADGLLFAGTSPARVLEQLRRYLTDPSALPLAVASGVGSPPSAAACARCGAPVDASMSFCSGCGAPLSFETAGQTKRACESCGKVAESGQRFCSGCGNRLA